MEITQVQYNQIAPYMPRQRGNVSLSNLQVLNAILYVVESGCMWRGLPERFGNWHTVYTRMNRWEKSGTLSRIFEQLQKQRIIRIRIEAVSAIDVIVKTDSHEKINASRREIFSYSSGNSKLLGISKFIWLPRVLEQV